ncbi:MAG: GNAT family N-acetyltransferase [Desulfovibrionaceae bacterium]|nr:GNAT family N-acetyltransferase [Desulfovibrionaceae bacterium]MBF0515140.1 GNAT family N-acetyltransferase [Desulfovibrionaceae bacterium]
MDKPRFERQDDLSAILGRDCYRLVHLDYSRVAADLAALKGPSFVEARLWGNDAFNARVLMGLDFRKICLQSVLVAQSLPEGGRTPRLCPQPLTVLELETTLLARHARNFHCNSLEFDTGVSEAAWSAFNRTRLEQSLASPEALKFVRDDGLVSFKPEGGKVVIDLLSVLTHRKGTGTALMRRVFDWSLANGAGSVEVMTECENIPAWLFYQKCGFRLTGNIAVFHRHAGDPKQAALALAGRGDFRPKQGSRFVPETEKRAGLFSTQRR